MKTNIVIKNGEDLYKLFSVEISNKDGSIFIRHLWHLNAKSSYHNNFGTNMPPFRYHMRGCAGNIIADSIQERTKFITNYKIGFLEVNFSELPDDVLVKNMSDRDVILDISSKSFSKYRIVFFSDYRKDLLEREATNAVVAPIIMTDNMLIVGCFDN